MRNKVFPKSHDEVEEALLKRGIIIIGGDINQAMCDRFLSKLLLLELIDSPPITIRINSGGGDRYCSNTMHDALKLYKGETTGLVIGKAASGAAMILQACNNRESTKNSRILVHFGQQMIYNADLGDEEIRAEIINKIEEDNDNMVNIFKRSNLTVPELIKLLKRDCYISAKKALEYRLIDKIID